MKWVLARHAHAASAVGTHDRSRQLSPKGLEQAASTRDQLIAKFGGRFVPDIIFSSPLLRVEQTTDILLGGHEGREMMPIISLPGLFDHPVVEKRPRCQASFDRLKYAPLTAYYQDPDGILMKEIAVLAERRMGEMMEELKENVVLVTGHAVILPALFETLAAAYGGFENDHPFMAQIREINLAEAEAIYWDSDKECPDSFEIIKPRVEQISDELHRAADALANATPVKADLTTTTVAELVGGGEAVAEHRYPDHELEGRRPDGVAILKPGAPGHA